MHGSCFLFGAKLGTEMPREALMKLLQKREEIDNAGLVIDIEAVFAEEEFVSSGAQRQSGKLRPCDVERFSGVGTVFCTEIDARIAQD